MKINWENIDLKSKKIIQKAVDDFFRNLKISSETEISFHFLKSTEIKALNIKYRKLNTPTDVLSFPLWPDLKSLPQKGIIHLGDIFICPEIVTENAEKWQIPYEKELEKITVHSLNHLIGKHH